MMLNRLEPIQDDSRVSAQAIRMIELICVFMFVSVFENVFCVSRLTNPYTDTYGNINLLFY